MHKKMDEKDFQDMHAFLQDLTILSKSKESVYYYWNNRVLGRIEELEPLIKELKEKDINLLSLSPELNKEWINLNDCKALYKFKNK